MISGAKGYALYSLGFFIVLEIMLAAAVLFWPSFMENIGTIKAIASPVPMLKEMVGQLGEGGVAGYIVGQHFFKGCCTLGTAAAVLFASGAVAGEAHRGTLEAWLARPVSRRRLLTERWVMGLIAVTAPVFATSLTVPTLLERIDETMNYDDLVRCSFHMSTFLAMLYSLTFLWSAHGSEPLRISFVMVFFTIMQFAVYMVEVVTNYSLYRLVDMEVFMDLVLGNTFDWKIVGPLVALTAVFYVLSLRGFARRVP